MRETEKFHATFIVNVILNFCFMQYGTYFSCYLFILSSSLAEQSKPTKTSYRTLHGRTSCTMTSGALCSPTAAATSPSAPSAPSPSASTTSWVVWTPGATTCSTWVCTAVSLHSSLHSVAFYWVEDRGACWRDCSSPLIPYTPKR